MRRKKEAVHHPAHYGGVDNPYEAIKVIEAWGLGFHLGNSAKYICRAGKKTDRLEDLKKARWYLDRDIKNLEGSVAEKNQDPHDGARERPRRGRPPGRKNSRVHRRRAKKIA